MVTRLEIIDETGRVYVNRNIKSSEVIMQDDNRTMKIFITNKKDMKKE